MPEVSLRFLMHLLIGIKARWDRCWKEEAGHLTARASCYCWDFKQVVQASFLGSPYSILHQFPRPPNLSKLLLQANSHPTSEVGRTFLSVQGPRRTGMSVLHFSSAMLLSWRSRRCSNKCLRGARPWLR
jgi:hypothetical protein